MLALVRVCRRAMCRRSFAVKKTISLPPDLAGAAEAMAQADGKTLSAVVQDALRHERESRLRKELGSLQNYWSRRAKEPGILTEEDLQRYLDAGEVVEPTVPLAVLAYEPDNRILKCAVEADAQMVVTGDRAMLALGKHRGIRIASLAEYLG